MLSLSGRLRILWRRRRLPFIWRIYVRRRLFVIRRRLLLSGWVPFRSRFPRVKVRFRGVRLVVMFTLSSLSDLRRLLSVSVLLLVLRRVRRGVRLSRRSKRWLRCRLFRMTRRSVLSVLVFSNLKIRISRTLRMYWRLSVPVRVRLGNSMSLVRRLVRWQCIGKGRRRVYVVPLVIFTMVIFRSSNLSRQ